ncbi:MAG: BrnT family toxin [Dehalococcoidia bacterium]|nr:BrnT family toxin [Dehalococcoidia bacterium]
MEFDWDEGNRHKNLRHGVHDWEIEEAFGGDSSTRPAASHSRFEEERFVIFGRARTSGKYLRIVYTVREIGGHRFIRPISAVEMRQREKRRYRRRQ